MDNDYAAQLGTILNGISPVSPQAIKMLVDIGSIHTFQKNEIVFSEKRYNAFEYFQIEGIAHRYNNNEEGLDITTGIYAGGSVITPNFARTMNGQSIFSLQVLTESVYLKIPIGTFDEIRRQNTQIWALGQRVIENEFIRNLNFEVLFRSCSAKDRLVYFRTHFHQLENLIPHTVIASFLGITPVSFSRLRHELAKKGA